MDTESRLPGKWEMPHIPKGAHSHFPVLYKAQNFPAAVRASPMREEHLNVRGKRGEQAELEHLMQTVKEMGLKLMRCF